MSSQVKWGGVWGYNSVCNTVLADIRYRDREVRRSERKHHWKCKRAERVKCKSHLLLSLSIHRLLCPPSEVCCKHVRMCELVQRRGRMLLFADDNAYTEYKSKFNVKPCTLFQSTNMETDTTLDINTDLNWHSISDSDSPVDVFTDIYSLCTLKGSLYHVNMAVKRRDNYMQSLTQWFLLRLFGLIE